MTTEEKARAYDEALEKALSVCDNDESLKKTFGDIFPQVLESEYERTRKSLIKYIAEQIDSLGIDIRDEEDEKLLKNLNKWLKWIEKQTGPFYVDTSSCEPWSDEQTSRQSYLEYLEKCKPIEWHDIDENILAWVSKIIESDSSLTIEDNKQLQLWLNSLRQRTVVSDDESETQDNSKNTANSETNIVWTDEDTKMADKTWQALLIMNRNDYKRSDEISKCAKWISSLRNRMTNSLLPTA